MTQKKYKTITTTTKQKTTTPVSLGRDTKKGMYFMQRRT